MLLEKNLIGGTWTGGSDTLEIRNPSNLDEVVGTYGMATAADVNAAFAAARRAQPAWRGATIEQRSMALDAISRMIFEQKDRLAEIMAREGGKTIPDALGEVVRAGHIARFFAGEALRIPGEKMGSVRPGVDVEITREPVGVVGLITPWNFPIAVSLWKISPALAFGNAIVWKPSEKTPGISAAIAEIVAASGVPAGVFNMVIGRGPEVGAAVVEGADAVSFTGSAATGRRIAVRCAERMVRCQLEMGGKNPLVVLDDADLDLAADLAVNGAYFQAGQRCTASSRLIVTSGIHDAFAKAVATRLEKVRIGPALDKETQVGPVIDESQFEKNLKYVEIGKQENARLASGGNPLQLSTRGWFLAPTLFADTTNTMQINREEIFGPFASIIRVADYDEALAVANDTEYGLSAGIVTTSMKYARHFQANVQAGMTMLNLPTAGVDYHTPFGGRKMSSYGPREQGRYAVEFYTMVKTSYLAA
ncbi:aldehyde dehydrogenase family protein [Microvirga sp. G4-2]|uniref:aldehyde dehydrogenase family protein n=1 Tax=Microvirga sp. G4-2 TaxID=3434467 RepID=UPI0040440C12